MVSRRTISVLLGALFVSFGLGGGVLAAENDQVKTAGGVTVYLGVVPAEIVKGLPATGTREQPMHGGVPKGPHEYHFVAAVFDATSGARISDADVTAEVAGLGLSGSKKRLEPMQIAGTTTYGGFFDLPGFDLYNVKLSVQRADTRPAVLEFKYDHRR
jgi:hypothetical protein